MIPFTICHFWQIRPRDATPLFGCFCVLVFVAAGYGQTNQVSRLIDQMKDKNESKSYTAVQELVKIGTPAVEPLIAALKDPNDQVRESAVDVLLRIKDPRAIEPLIAVFKDPKPKIRWGAVGAVEQFGTPAVEPLISALTDADALVRMNAAGILDRLKDPRAVEPLISALKDSDSTVRAVAAGALVWIKDPRMVEPLIAVLMNTNDRRDFDLRVHLVATLILFKDPRVAGALKTVGPVTITEATSDLIRRGEPGSEDALIEVLNKFGDTRTAENFLNCGNSTLEDAARNWATERGFGITTTKFGQGYAKWPSKR